MTVKYNIERISGTVSVLNKGTYVGPLVHTYMFFFYLGVFEKRALWKIFVQRERK